MTFTIRLAGRNIQASVLFPSTKVFLNNYLTDAQPDFSVSVSPEDVTAEREKSAAEDAREGVPTRQFPDTYLETLALYRHIAEQMPAYGTVLIHGSAIAVDGKAYLFTAKSGTGKSTHTRLWREMLGDRAFMVNDDKPLVTVTEGGVLVHGTPWDGKHRLSRNTSVPLGAICLLERSETNHIEQLTPKEVFQPLLNQTYRPSDPETLIRTVVLLKQMQRHVTFWRLGCNMDPEAAAVAFTAMSGASGLT